MVFDQGRKTELKLACFLRARQKLIGRRLSKSRYGTNVRARFARRENSLVKNFSDQKERSFDLLSFEGKRIDVGANKLKLRRFEIRAFCDKMRSFCTISASTFWKIQPDIWQRKYIYGNEIYIYIYIYIYIFFFFFFFFSLPYVYFRCHIYIFFVALYIFLVAFTYFGCRIYIFGCRINIFGCRTYIFGCRTYIFGCRIYFWLTYIYFLLL